MSLFALVDCNNFFVSCERVFAPSLAKKPVIVLSNNDGCVISRSEEAKARGIAMGAPLYTIKRLCAQFDVSIISSNFELYGNFSQRIMACLRSLCPAMEIYSIDEAFLQLDNLLLKDPVAYAETVRSCVYKWTGIPVSIGIASTKTLAKVAAEIAKQNNGVGYLLDKAAQCKALENLPVENIWGIGRRTSEKLRSLGITTALHLRQADPSWIRKTFTVVGERIALELSGVSCLGLEEVPPKKSIICSASFGRSITTFDELAEAVSNYVVSAANRLRQQESHAQYLTVAIRTSPFRQNSPFYSNEATLTLAVPTFETTTLIRTAKEGLKQIFRPGYTYQKGGVVLSGIHPMNWQQGHLFMGFPEHARSQKFYGSVDRLNQRWGKDTILIAAQGLKREWKRRSERRSPRYTTRWTELPLVHTG